MPLNSEAKFLSNDFLAPGLLEAFPNRLQFLTVFPFFSIHGNSVTYVVTPELSFGEPLGFCDPIPEHTKLPEVPVRNFELAELASHWEVSYKSQDIFCETNDQFATQAGLALRQVLYRFGEQFEIGSTAVDPETFNGLRRIVDPGQVINKNCDPLTLDDLDKAKGLVRGNNGYAGVIITNQLGYEIIRKVHYDITAMPKTEVVSVPDPLGGTRTQQLTKFDGWIIYINDNQPTEICETPLGTKEVTNIWFAILGWNHLHGIIPDCVGDSMFVQRKQIREDNSKVVGHVTWPVGLALGSPSSLAQIKDVSLDVVGLGV